MRKFQEFVENKSLQLEQAEQGRTSSSGGDLGLRGVGGESPLSHDPDDYDLGTQQKGDEREERWDWLIDKSKSYQDALEKIRNLAKEYLSGVSRHPADRDIIRLVDEILPKTKETYSDQGVFRPKF